MLTIEQALRAILDAIGPLSAERVALDCAIGRFVASTIVAREDAPAFDGSMMDGWAVRADELAAAPVALPIALEVRAGHPTDAPLPPGSVARIFTGAPIPEGADTVVMQEDAVHDGALVRFREPPRRGQHVRRRGEDLLAGATLLSPGALVGSGEIALLASQGHASLDVHRRPLIAVLGNGDELRDIADPPRAGSVIDSNGPMLAAAIREAGAEAITLPRAPDDLAVLTARVREGLRADALVIAGGVSVGDHDLVHRALADAGVETRFWKVAMKPGKPLTFGLAAGRDPIPAARAAARTPVFGLPGNPVSAWVTFELFVRPALRTMLGDPRPLRATIDVTLGAEVRHGVGRVELVRAQLAAATPHPIATVRPRQGSGSIPSISGADALLILDADRDRFAAGETLRALLLRPPGSARPPS
jgi:molybdopterin molybdotransferase